MGQAAEAASLLYYAGAKRVWLFGSIARREVRDNKSDLDLAVEGLDEHLVKSLRSSLRARLRCKVDVVSMDRALPQLREGILKCRVAVSREACQNPNGLVTELPNRPVPSSFPEGLQETRMRNVLESLGSKGVSSVLDLGCGNGMLIERLAAEPGIIRLLGVDSSMAALETARQRLGLSCATATQGKISLIQALATNPDPQFQGFDAVTAVEVIEHLDPARLSAFGRVVFHYLRPALVIMTTPNFEYNVRWNSAPVLRRKDHRFEWTRSQFRDWVTTFASRRPYICEFKEIGTSFRNLGAPTQMVICSTS